MHQFLGDANVPRIGGHGSEVLLFTMRPPSKIKSPSYSTIDHARSMTLVPNSKQMLISKTLQK
jgi:hypothetical protein